MSNTINTTKASRSTLLENARKAISVYTTIIKDGKALNEQTIKAKSTMDKAVSDFNEDMLAKIYDRVLSAPNPVSAFAKTNKYSKAMPRLTKEGTIVYATGRLDLTKLFAYAKKVGTPIVDEFSLTDAVKVLTTAIETLISARINKGKEDTKVELSKAKCALHKVLVAINVEGVKAREVDVEYLALVLTRAKSMGVIAKIESDSTMRYLMDVFHAQLTPGFRYDFANADAK